MEQIKLAAKKRNSFGSRVSRRIRKEGSVPAILYGHGMDTLSIQVNSKELTRALHTKAGENVVINLQVEGVNLKESTCLIKSIQHDPVTENIDHVDFGVISLTETIVVKVPLVTVNAEESVGVKEGGVLDVVHHEIEVECLPTAIPEKIEVDVKAMKINDAIYAKDLSLPDGVVCKFDPEEMVVAVHPPQKEEEVVPGEGATEPEVIEKGKKVDEEAAEGKAEPQAAAPKAEKKPEKKPEKKA